MLSRGCSYLLLNGLQTLNTGSLFYATLNSLAYFYMVWTMSIEFSILEVSKSAVDLDFESI